MKKILIAKKVLAFMTCSALSAGFITAYPSISDHTQNISARTIAEIQEEREANEAKIAEYENQINALEGDKNSEKVYQENLSSQISLIQDNITLLNQELDKISADIEMTEQNIAALDITIAQQQKQIEDNVELFKERLCAMYISGNENLASVVLGSASFYDMMSRVEMVNRMAAYDEELINKLLDEIDALEKSKKDLETEKATLEMKLDDQQKKKDEKAQDIVQLNDKMQKTQEIIDRIQLEQDNLQISKSEAQKINDDLDKEEAAIQAEIKKNAELAQKRYEEEQRRILAEKKAAEEKAAAEKAAAEKAAAEKAAAEKAAAEKAAAEKAAAEKAAADKAAADKAAADKAAADKAAADKAAADKAAADKAAADKAAAQTTTAYVEPVTQATTTAPAVVEIPAPSSSGFVWPIPGFYYISSGFGARWGRNHNGIDVGDAGISGGAIVASKAGTVTFVNNSCTHNYGKSSSCGCGGGYGNYVMIQHDGTYTTVYGHMTNAIVSVGDYVQQGQVIGYAGSTGWSTGAHLHFEVRVNGYPKDPLGFVSP